MTTFRSYLPCLALACALVPAAQAQPTPPTLPQNVLQLSASGTVEVPQDLLSISLTTTREGADAAVVQSQLSAVVEAALAEARKQAQPGLMDVRSGAFSLYPRYGKEGRISTWQGTAELVLEGRDFARISSTAGRVPGMAVGQVGFSLSREARARSESQAQAMAIERFQGKASELARGFGFSAYGLREVHVQADDAGVPMRQRSMAMSMAGAADKAVPVEAGQSTVTVTVSGSVQMR